MGADRRGFEALVRQHQPAVRRFLLHLTLGNASLADDLAQETFIKAYLHMSQFRAESAVATWLMRIAYNTFYDHRRSLKAPMDTLTADTGGLPTAAAAADCALRHDIAAALATLRDDERTCITLQLVEGYDIKSVARITGMKEGTVKSHLSRGKEKLTEYLTRNGYDRTGK